MLYFKKVGWLWLRRWADLPACRRDVAGASRCSGRRPLGRRLKAAGMAGCQGFGTAACGASAAAAACGSCGMRSAGWLLQVAAPLRFAAWQPCRLLASSCLVLCCLPSDLQEDEKLLRQLLSKVRSQAAQVRFRVAAPPPAASAVLLLLSGCCCCCRGASGCGRRAIDVPRCVLLLCLFNWSPTHPACPMRRADLLLCRSAASMLQLVPQRLVPPRLPLA